MKRIVHLCVFFCAGSSETVLMIGIKTIEPFCWPFSVPAVVVRNVGKSLSTVLSEELEFLEQLYITVLSGLYMHINMVFELFKYFPDIMLDITLVTFNVL